MNTTHGADVDFGTRMCSAVIEPQTQRNAFSGSPTVLALKLPVNGSIPLSTTTMSRKLNAESVDHGSTVYILSRKNKDHASTRAFLRNFVYIAGKILSCF